jgi:hypothetical protein
MSRICPHCGTANDAYATHCGACATQMVSTSTALVRARPQSRLPVLSQREKATVGGVALGVAAVALRVGLALLKQVAESTASSSRPSTSVEQAPVEAAPATPKQGTIIRRRWVVGDSIGPLRWGEEEIEIQPGDDDRGSYRFWLGRPNR